MPLDIMPAPAGPPSVGTSTAADTTAGLPPANGANTLLFGLLLAQTTAQASPKAAPAAGRETSAASTAINAVPGPEKQTTDTATTVMPPIKKLADKAKNETPTPTMMPAAGLIWTATAPPTIPQNIIPSPADAPLDAGARRTAETPSVTPTAQDSTVNSGTAMDTAPQAAGELLSFPQAQPASNLTGSILPDSATFTPAVSATPAPAVTFTSLVGDETPTAASQTGAASAATSPASAVPSRPTLLWTTPQAPTPAAGTPLADVSPSLSPAGAQPPSAAVTAAITATLEDSSPQTVTSPGVSARAVKDGMVNFASAPQSAPAGRTQALSTPSLQNRPAPADNQSGKSTVSKITGSQHGSAQNSQTTVSRPAIQAVASDQPAPAKDQKDQSTSDSGRDAQPSQTDPAMAVPQAQSAPVASQSVTPMPVADRSQMLGQVEHSITAMTVQTGAGGPQQVTLQLHPKDWGQLKVSVTMTPAAADGSSAATQVVAHVVAEHPSVKAALENGQTELRHALRGAGLHLDRLTVTVQAPSGGSGSSLGDSQSQSRSGQTWSGGQGTPQGGSTQGGASSGGGNPPPFAGFAQDGQSGRRPPMSPYAASTPAAQESDDAPAAVLARVGRVDTRA